MELSTVGQLISVMVAAIIVIQLCAGTTPPYQGQRRDLFFYAFTKHGFVSGGGYLIVRGEDVGLRCGAFNSQFYTEIRRLSDGKELVSCFGVCSLVYWLIQVTCQDNGTYVCVVDYEWSETFHIEIYDCLPQCPREVKVIDQRLSVISLSWIPVSDGGVNQSFHVYSSEDNVTWDKHDVTHGDTTINVSDLHENTSYCFRVASSNDVRPAVNESVCQNTICGHTLSRMRPAATVKSPDLSSKGDNRILELILVAGILAVVGFTVGFLTHWYRRSGGEDKSRNVALPLSGHDLPCTHYEEIRDVISNLPDNSEGSTNPEICCLELLVKRPGRSSQDDDVPPHTHYITPASETSDSERYVNLARRGYSDIQI